ncbi:MAG: hypothetical protein ACI8SR_000796 [Oceanicoccus sp.]|jgi:hypothetical protein
MGAHICGVAVFVWFWFIAALDWVPSPITTFGDDDPSREGRCGISHHSSLSAIVTPIGRSP